MPSPIFDIISDLRTGDQTACEAASKKLFELRYNANSVTLEEGLQALRAAAEPLPPRHPDPKLSEHLLDILATNPRPEYIPLVVELFDKFSPESRWWAQAILTGLDSPEAARAYMQIVRTHAQAGRIPRLLTGPLRLKPRHGDIFFPELLGYATIPAFTGDIYHLCLVYCQAGQIPAGKLEPFTQQVLEAYRPYADWLHAAQELEGSGWIWEEAYQERRHPAGILLDLFSYFPVAQVEGELRAALDYRDPELKYYAAASLWHLGKEVNTESIEQIAAAPEVRISLYQTLKNLNKDALYPKQYYTQAAFAESDMVNWLTYPTELGRVPDEIDLMKVVAVDTGLPDGIYDYYLFRFKTNNPNSTITGKWIAGVSGPFSRKDAPTTRSLGDTFSTFDLWEGKKPEEHLGNIRELMVRWRDYHAKERK